MTDGRKYLIFKIVLRTIATSLVITGWLLHGTTSGSVLFWAGVGVTVFSFFL